VVWLVVAVGFGALLVAARAAEAPLDDLDPAYQRPGLLDLGALPRPAPPVTGDVPAPGSEAVVFFVRPDGLDALCDAVAGTELDGAPDLVAVVARSVGSCAGDIPVVVDVAGRLAEGYGLREPADGGPPVGYAVVDPAGQIRYRTLDPEVDDLLTEVDTILRAV
jgi:hypothetical protein